jgi:hypothetical protein
LILGITNVPNNLRVSSVQTIYKELTKLSSSLTVTIIASPHGIQTHLYPWKFGFNFDLTYPDAWQRVRGTCMIFSVDEPSDTLQNGRGLDTPECALKWARHLKANAWCELGPLRVKRVKYDEVTMWRLASVGYRKGEFLRSK